MKNRLKRIMASTAMLLCVASHAQQKQTDMAESSPFDMRKILDASTLGVEVLKDWHVVKGDCPTRQRLITIRVGELWAGQDYRIPVRMIVPADRKAKGFHLTGGHQLKQIQKDAQLRGVEKDLIRGGVGLGHFVAQDADSGTELHVVGVDLELPIEDRMCRGEDTCLSLGLAVRHWVTVHCNILGNIPRSATATRTGRLPNHEAAQPPSEAMAHMESMAVSAHLLASANRPGTTASSRPSAAAAPKNEGHRPCS